MHALSSMNRSGIKACLFDVFGTVVDWRGSVSRDLAAFAQQKGIRAIDWVEFAVDWRRLYQPSMEEVRSGRRPWTILDVLHRESLVRLIERYRIEGLSEADVDHMNRAWHRLELAPAAVLMVAAHNNDLKAAKAQGLATAFVARPTEHGPGQTSDLAPDSSCVELATRDFIELAERLG